MNQKPKITAEHFYKFFQCPHWIWYDIYGDAKQKKHTPPLLDIIYKGKVSEAEKILSQRKQFEQVRPELMRDIEEGFLATLELMKQGKNIYHGVLMNEDWVGMPDLLEARPGKSDLGAWHYVVYDVQQSLELRDEFRFQLVFYSLILERIQGVRPSHAYIIDPEGNERAFLIDDYVEQFHLSLAQIEKILEGEKPLPFLKSGCRRTPWYSLCVSETEGCSDVSLVYRLSQADQRHLYDIGIKTIFNLAEADVNDLRIKLEDWPFDKIVRLNNQAKVLVSREPLILKKGEFPSVKNEIYFDIESDPTRDIDYLLGILVKSGGKGNGEYHYFLAHNKEEEPEMWKKFLDFLAELDDFVIYHYAFYERRVFDRLASRYGAPESLVAKFRENTIDIHLKLVESAVLPLYFYSLKDAAKYLGYQWNDPEAGGAESVVWYNDWLDKHNNAVLKKILKYNEDDVRATLRIKEWLETQAPKKSREKLEE
ncbi:MAG: hypothetical protein A2746_01185 [Candidatus Yanofskybacteria bacterium RIFCSPHIGHO2_01_FULL_44_22]|uniref:YprB ribonuclease H-like domain-containing protein n=1 Tax=Candidatus Yanofskybacteria bacterium RIFCSPHIGHO2_01_FULL_44_22 TaxID=1802669 RepID=A0A1F8EVS3_9BACT|nr:MAG: hypothetical protein A2746_01185 [Candidatus Yanofskybacteria bacterium RIFCSPHIGHO2_01_FULL_44_22]